MNGFVLEEGKRRKLLASARLLTSDREGEVIAALGAIERLLPDGKRLEDVLAVSIKPRNDWVLEGNWKQQASWAVLEHPSLTDWERNFCESVFHYRHPSPKQLATLREICERGLEQGGAV